MAGIEHSAQQGEQVAGVDGQVIGEGHQPYPGNAQQGGGDVVPVGPQLHHRPGEEGDDYTVHRREEGVFGGGGPGQAEGLHRVGQEQESADYGPPPEVVRGEYLPALPGDQGQQERSGGKPDGQQEEYRHHVQSIFHDKEGGAPDKGGGKQHGLGQHAHGFV